MSFLGRKGKKQDIVRLAEELKLNPSPDMRIIELKNLIVNSEDYDEVDTPNFYDMIVEQRLEEEKREAEAEKRAEKREAEERAEKREAEKRAEITRQQEFELEKLRLESGMSSSSGDTSGHNNVKITTDIQKLVPKFDPDKSDISLYLTIFERQVTRTHIDKSDWVSLLSRVVPIDIVQIIARESDAVAEDYEHIKKVLLQRFKLSPEIFRQKFTGHKKQVDQTWRDFSWEIGNYFDEWVRGLNVLDFESLRDLIITDQIKRKVTYEIRDHFIDEWAELKSVQKTCELLDTYENVRKGHKKPFEKSSTFERSKNFPPKKKEGKPVDAPRTNYSPDFDRRKVLRCYRCGSDSHLRPSCPLLKGTAKLNSTEQVNKLEDVSFHHENKFLTPYTSKGSINGNPIRILRDSGASLDIVCQKYVESENFTGEQIWVKQALDLDHRCLPLAIVNLSGEFGNIKTKAAVCTDDLDEGRYILGNRTTELISEKLGYEFSKGEVLNAVQTRSQTKQLELKKLTKSDTVLTSLIKKNEGVSQETGEVIIKEVEEGDPIKIPEVNLGAPELSLVKISSDELKKAQLESSGLRELFDLASQPETVGKKKSYIVENDILLKIQESKMGEIKKLVVVPEILRDKIQTLCHESTSAHVGVTKSKDKLSRYFYWPDCYKDMENFVRTCPECQIAGKPNDKKKAPLKLVPVIQEVFSKLNIDACGPLPTTENGNKYLITAICLSSKYPEAIPVPDISSVSVTNALLNVFSRMGFPKEIQTDQGTSFTSVLTSEFFDRFGIRVCHSSVYHPQSNPVERMHRTVKRLLRALCMEAGTDWEKHLPSALLALRTVVHESTGYTPAELVHGKNLRTPETLLYEHWLEPGEENHPVTEYVFQLVNRLKRCQELAVEKMEDLKIKRKLWYDKNAVKREFKPGDLVLVLAMHKPNKLAVQWMGPGKIVSKLSETNYVVEIQGKRERSQVYHVNMMKPFYKRQEYVNFLNIEEREEGFIDHDLDFPYLETDSTVYDFQDIIKTSDLEKILEPQQIEQLQQLLNRYEKTFSNEPGLTDLVEHDIELISNKPIRAKPYRTSHRQNEILKTEIQRMLEMKIIEVGEGEYTSPMILVEAPGKDPRPCCDYRKLNEIIRDEYFPLPNIEERVEQVASAKYISVLDLTRGYFQVKLTKQAQKIATFCTNFGTYRPLRLCFGLKNAPFVFSKLMAEVLKDCEAFAVPYLDDIAIFSNSWEEHLQHLNIVLERITKAKLTIKPSKCRFAQNHVKYLGHMVGHGFRSPADAKIKSILDFPTPHTKTQIRAFLGLAGYYGRYINGYSVVAAPLTNALKGKLKKGEVVWSKECEKAFQELKNRLTSKPVLYAPDFGREFIVQTDACDLGMGVVLTQLNEQGEEHPILYLSKKFSSAEQKYCTTEKECASIIFAVKKLHYYLDGKKFRVVTDHNPLVWLRSNASSNPRLMRWALALQQYDFKIVHRSGKENKNADSLSRSFDD